MGKKVGKSVIFIRKYLCISAFYLAFTKIIKAFGLIQVRQIDEIEDED